MADETIYHYRYEGVAEVCYPEATAHGYTWVQPGDELELPVLLDHADLVPTDSVTINALEERRAAIVTPDPTTEPVLPVEPPEEPPAAPAASDTTKATKADNKAAEAAGNDVEGTTP